MTSVRDLMSTVGRLLAVPLMILLRGYQRFVSPLTPPTCRFTPSCSAYALTALQRFGLFKGTWLAIRRVLRCHPWNPGGVDHVPAREDSTSPSVTNNRRNMTPATRNA